MRTKHFVLPLIVLLLAVTGSIALGGVAGYPAEVFTALIRHDHSTLSQVLWNIRLPRVLLAMLVGAGLSLAGALMQTMFRNPLADPAILGISSGSALGLVMALLAGLEFGSISTSFCAVLGGLFAIAIISGVTRRKGAVSADTSTAGFVLVGVALNAFIAGALGILLSATSNPQARSISFWTLGTISLATWKGLTSVALFFVAGLIVISLVRTKANLLALEDYEIRILGANPSKLRFTLAIGSAILVASATSIVGVISFVGLITPYAIRLVVGPNVKLLLPIAALWGSILVLISDTLARTLIHSMEIPIGTILALIGSPIFVWVLVKRVRA